MLRVLGDRSPARRLDGVVLGRTGLVLCVPVASFLATRKSLAAHPLVYGPEMVRFLMDVAFLDLHG